MRWFKAEKVIAMKELRYLAAMLIVCGIALPALAQEQVALTIYVHEGDLDGDLLEGVAITGADASGNEFSEVTDSNGAAIVSGEPGLWQFAFKKAGYSPLYLTYNATQDEQTAAYLEKDESSESITLTVHVNDGDLDGDPISGVQIKGADGSGNEFAAETDSSGIAVISGEPGVWQFAFQKTGYDILFLRYNATATDETAAYLEKTA